MRKVRFYERYQDAKPKRFRVLAVTSGGQTRLRNLLACAASVARNPQRSLVYGVTLSSFLAEQDALTARCVLNHRAEATAIVPNTSRLSPSAAADPGNLVDAVLASAPCRVPLSPV